MALEGGTFARKSFDKMKAKNAPVSASTPEEGGAEPEKEPTLSELRNDATFASFLESQNDLQLAEVAARWKDNKATESDMDVLVRQREGHLERRRQLNATNTSLDAEFKSLRETFSDLDKLCKANGEEAFKETMKQGLYQAAFRDPAKFNFISKSFEALAAAEKQLDDPANDLNKKFDDFRKRYPLSEGEFDKVMQIADEGARAREIQSHLREHMGFFERFYDEFRGIKGVPPSREAAAKMAENVTELHRAYETINTLRKKAAQNVRNFVMKDQEMLTAMQRAGAGDRELFKERGIESKMAYADLQPSLSEFRPNAEEIQRNWAHEKQARGIDTSSMSDVEIKKMQDAFLARYVKEKMGGKRSGFWRTVLVFLVGKRFDDMDIREKLK